MDNIDHSRNPMTRFMKAVYDVIDGPVTFFREKVIDPNHQQYPYYHQKFNRVPTIDECETDDAVCEFEAQQQWNRDKLVDDEILNILRQRHSQCVHEDRDHSLGPKCTAIWEYYKDNEAAWFAKYGDLGPFNKVIPAFMKQKHRMIWERRHGPVGTGMKNVDKYPLPKEDTHLFGNSDEDTYLQTYKTEDGKEEFRKYNLRPFHPIAEDDGITY